MLWLLWACGQSSDSHRPAADDSVPDSGAPADDTGTPSLAPSCDDPIVLFVGADDQETDLTSAFLDGTYTTLDRPGTLYVCPSTWFARVLVRADVDVIGLGDDPADTVLSAGEEGTILDVGGPITVHVENVTLDRGAGLDKAHNSGGGGLYCCGDGANCVAKVGKSRGAVSIENVVFSHNTANDGSGFYGWECDFDVKDSVLTANHSDDDGGAVSMWYSTLALDGTTFEDNEGLDGGAMALFYSSATIAGSTFRDNTGGDFSGGIWASYESPVSITDTTFEGNTNVATYEGAYGGALIAFEEATLTNVSFVDNSAPHGAGIFVYYNAVVDGAHCDFADNATDDIWAAGYDKPGGTSYDEGDDASFHCAKNACAAE